MDNLNTTLYDEGWKTTETPVYVNELNDTIENTASKEKIRKKKSNDNKPLLIIIQLIICTLLVIFLFALKTFGGELYKNISNWYIDNLNNEIILTEEFTDFNLDDLISNED